MPNNAVQVSQTDSNSQPSHSQNRAPCFHTQLKSAQGELKELQNQRKEIQRKLNCKKTEHKDKQALREKLKLKDRLIDSKKWQIDKINKDRKSVSKKQAEQRKEQQSINQQKDNLLSPHIANDDEDDSVHGTVDDTYAD